MLIFTKKNKDRQKMCFQSRMQMEVFFAEIKKIGIDVKTYSIERKDGKIGMYGRIQ